MLLDDEELLDDVRQRLAGGVDAEPGAWLRLPWWSGSGRSWPIPISARGPRTFERWPGSRRAHRRRAGHGERRRHPGRPGADPGADGRTRRRGRTWHRAGRRQPEFARRDPGALARDSGGGGCRSEVLGLSRAPRRSGRRHRRAARRPAGGNPRAVPAAGGELADRQAGERSAAGAPAKTADGTRIAVEANLGSAAEAWIAAEHGADGAGLVRTEFLFLGPGQGARSARAVGGVPGDRRGAARPADHPAHAGHRRRQAGQLPADPKEDNPYLGHRGIRLGLAHRELLREQLAAVCEVARHGPTSVMFPMVTTVAELRTVRGLLEESAGPAGMPAGLQVGMMVEVPAAALKITSFLPYLDFVSIGTNDLAQYTLAAERGNAEVADLSDPLDPGVLRLIHHVCHTIASRIPVTVCGELAADPQAVRSWSGSASDDSASHRARYLPRRPGFARWSWAAARPWRRRPSNLTTPHRCGRWSARRRPVRLRWPNPGRGARQEMPTSSAFPAVGAP